LKIIKINNHKTQMNVFEDKEILKPFEKTSKIQEYKVSGQAVIKIQW